MSRRSITHLILDFDSTLTTTDTISLLASTAYTLRPHSPPWSHFSSAYLADSTAHSRQYPPGSRTTLAAETAFLTSLLPIERASIQRIESACVFAGLRTDDIAQAASSTVPVRAGFWNLCRCVLDAGGAVDILSVNWSRVWIQSSLRGAIAASQERERFASEVGIYSNDLLCDSVGLTTGEITREPILGGDGGDDGIWTAAHKGTVMEHLVKKRGMGVVTMYVGDSSTDLLCLLKADVGVVIGDGLNDLCKRIGLELACGLGDADGKSGGQRLFKVRDLEDIGHWVTRNHQLTI